MSFEKRLKVGGIEVYDAELVFILERFLACKKAGWSQDNIDEAITACALKLTDGNQDRFDLLMTQYALAIKEGFVLNTDLGKKKQAMPDKMGVEFLPRWGSID